MHYIAVVISLLAVFPSYAVGEQIRVATWNIAHLSKSGDEKREPEDYERLRQIVESIESDVIALQEVDDEFAVKVFDPHTYTLEISGRRYPQKTGLAIRRGLQYERKADVEALDVRRVRYGTHVELWVGTHRVDVLSVHLKSGCFSNEEDEKSKSEDACSKLNKQIPILEEWIDGRMKDGRALIVLGDFNRRLAMDDDRVWREIADGEPGPIVLTTAQEKPRCWEGKYGEFIDHILVGPKASRWLSSFQEIVFREAATEEGHADWKDRLSDHCPLRATFNVEESSGL